MLRTLFLSTTLAVVAMISQAAAEDPTGKKRCSELIAYFDRWGATRSEHSDGARNVTRINAGIDCERGNYDIGIASMEALLLRKNFDVPRTVGAAPMFEPRGGATALAASVR